MRYKTGETPEVGDIVVRNTNPHPSEGFHDATTGKLKEFEVSLVRTDADKDWGGNDLGLKDHPKYGALSRTFDAEYFNLVRRKAESPKFVVYRPGEGVKLLNGPFSSRPDAEKYALAHPNDESIVYELVPRVKFKPTEKVVTTTELVRTEVK